jgi:hypothetical protein
MLRSKNIMHLKNGLRKHLADFEQWFNALSDNQTLGAAFLGSVVSLLMIFAFSSSINEFGYANSKMSLSVWGLSQV